MKHGVSIAGIVSKAVLVLVWSGLGVLAQQPAAPAAAAPAASPCLACHALIKTLLTRKVVHAAVGMGCDSCHGDHRKGGDGAANKQDHYLNSKQPDVCLTCHDAKEKAFTDAHRGQPAAQAVCTGCHNPHASDAPKLIMAEQHSPFAGRQCDSCHEAPVKGKVKLGEASTNALCFLCHDDMKTRLAGAKSKHSLIASSENSCIDCHDPHASDHKKFLKSSPASLCTSCHADVTKDKKFVHEPVQGGCTVCHDAHASDFKKNTHAAGNDLCMGCHGPVAIKIVQGPDPVSLFGGKVTLPAKAYENLSWLPLSEGGKLGHPYPKHPVSAPASEGKAEINCLSCHKPHAANGSRRLFVTETAKTDKLCLQCHDK